MTGDEFLKDHKDYAEKKVIRPFLKELAWTILGAAAVFVACFLAFAC